MSDMDPKGFPVSLDEAVLLSDEELSALLQSIIAKFKKCERSCIQFLKVYPEWKYKRTKSTKELDQIVKELESTKFTSNVVKIVGSSTSVVGSIVSIVGAVLIPFSFGFTTPLIVGGIVTGVTGGSLNIGMDVTEWCRLKGRMQEALSILKNDETEFQIIEEWFQHTAAFKEEVEKIFDFELLSKFVSAEKKPNLFDDSDSFDRKISSFFKSCAGPGLDLIMKIMINPMLCILFRELVLLLTRNPVVFSGAEMVTRIVADIFRGIDLGVDILSPVTAVTRIGTIGVSTSVAKAITHGIFSGVSLAIDIFSLYSASADTYNGSKCPKAEEIRTVNDKLKKETCILQDIYKTLILK